MTTREAIRVLVKKCVPNYPAEWLKFSVDPQITTLEVLYTLVAKAFNISNDFSIKYKHFDPAGNEIYLAVLSDGDLEAAFLRIHNIATQMATEPCLTLQVDVRPGTSLRTFGDDDHDEDEPASTPSTSWAKPAGAAMANGARELLSPLHNLTAAQNYAGQAAGLLFNQVGKTFSIMQKALNFAENGAIPALPPRAPLTDIEFRQSQDALGQVQRNEELRKVIFLGGIEPSLRRVVWKYLLNVYPSGMTGTQRMEFMRRKSAEYFKLRDTWKAALAAGNTSAQLAHITDSIRKDVLRTDRMHPYYAGDDDNQSITSLFNVLTTYGLNHAEVGYCQGMSDIASPLLVTMNDEAHAYICFCALMRRLRSSFLRDGLAMQQKYEHLKQAIQFYDPDFWLYLEQQQAVDLTFCHRWLLLELKREFPFKDTLRMLEVQWSALRYDKRNELELRLYDREFVPDPELDAPKSGVSSICTVPSVDNSLNGLHSLPRQYSPTSLRSTNSLHSLSTSAYSAKVHSYARQNHSLDDNLTYQAKRRQHRPSGKVHQSLDDAQIREFSDMRQSKSAQDSAATSEDTDDDIFDENQQQNQFHETNPFKADTERIPQSIAKLQHKNVISNYNAVTEIIAKQLSTKSGGHFGGLKQKIAEKSKLLSENIEAKLAKGFGELSVTKNDEIDQRKNAHLTKTVFSISSDDSQSSSLREASWSDATAIQQADNLSNCSPSNVPVQRSERQVSEKSFTEETPRSSTTTADGDDIAYEDLDRLSIDQEPQLPLPEMDVFIEQDFWLHKTQPGEDVSLPEILTPISTESGTNGIVEIGTKAEDEDKIAEPPETAPSIGNGTIQLKTPIALPTPNDLGSGNPFLIFLCLTLLLQHRDVIMDSGMDYNEIAMLFDRMMRQHDVTRVLNQARSLYTDYLRAHQLNKEKHTSSAAAAKRFAEDTVTCSEATKS